MFFFTVKIAENRNKDEYNIKVFYKLFKLNYFNISDSDNNILLFCTTEQKV